MIKPIGGRAQAFSTEFVFAYLIFMLVFSMTIFLWNTTIQDIIHSEEVYEMKEVGVDVTERLIRTAGVPEDWTNDSKNVTVIGLATESRILDADKVKKFIEMYNSSNTNYDDYKHLMSLGGSDIGRLGGFDFEFRIDHLNGSIYTLDGLNCSTGRPLNFSSDAQYLTTKRTAILTDEIVRVTMIIWREE
ncbi:MAG: hypothetical protein KAU03_04620 [Candidatus Altiarchaeales archaeon]|nr:hypothetical protein [Candidatus Altiarchaeales archaeon]